jgi:secernin
VITGLLERYGQGGDCGHLGRSYYNNGFIIADPNEAYVLETAGRWWAFEHVRRHRALSNAYSIGRSYDAVSHDLAAHARAQGWTGFGGRFDVAAHLIDEDRDAVSFGRGRCARGNALLSKKAPWLGPSEMMAILRDHGAADDWSPANTVGRTLCMHAAEGPRRSQSVGSMVSELRPGRTVHWVTGTSAPCTSIFKPVLFETGLPVHGALPNDWYDDRSLWWRHEELHRAMLHDLPAALAEISGDRDQLEGAFIAQIDMAFAGGPAALRHAVHECWRAADVFEARWATAFLGRGSAGASRHARSWARLNHLAGIPRT